MSPLDASSASPSGVPPTERIAVIGLGYVGLPLALALARRGASIVGFDTSEARVAALRRGEDPTGELERLCLTTVPCEVTTEETRLGGCNFFILAVPTPVDAAHRPDLTALRMASETVGRVMKAGAVVVVESTVYPGATEEVCGPVLERVSGLPRDAFKLGYSPERINPGDQEHTLERIVKVVSGEDEETLERVAAVYASIVEAGVHRAPSIRVAEAAKVIENTQRDLNVALMNELALIFDRLGISTRDVLAAAGTKWNFLPFTPGLVGGHCIGVDPYYLTTKAEEAGHHCEVILSGRRINDGMGFWIARRVVREFARQGKAAFGARIAVLGLTFKPDVTDLRNSRVPDIISELRDYGLVVLAHDPLADAQEAMEHYGVALVALEKLGELEAVVLAVPHKAYLREGGNALFALLPRGGVFYDVKSVMDRAKVPASIHYLSL